MSSNQRARLLLGARLLLTTVCFGVGSYASADEDSFHKGPGVFSTRPSETKSMQTIDRFGPVGMGIELHQPAFVMKIKNIEEGSPAATTGQFKAGQIVAAAEASDGLIKFMVQEDVNAKPGSDRGFSDNGKNGNLAFAMAAAASLTPGGEQSVYAAARDACAMTGFYTTTSMLHGYTGGGIGEIWRSAAMGLLHDKTPAKYRQFMDNRCVSTHHELLNPRFHDGASRRTPHH